MGTQISWNEKVDQRLLDFKFELEEISPASTKWVKRRAERNCLSADPADCLVWCLVETPTIYDTIVIQEKGYGCMEGFSFSENEEQCERTVKAKESTTSGMMVKVMDKLTGKEIKIEKFEAVKCY